MRKNIVFMLLCISIVLSFFGCGNQTKHAIIINDFETYDNLRYTKIDRCIGKLTFNENKEYITHGNYSVKFDVEQVSALGAYNWITSSIDTGSEDMNITPALLFTPTIEYNNIFNVSSYLLDVYNDENKLLKLTFAGYDVDGAVVISDIFDLHPKVMNHIKMAVNKAFYTKNTARIAKIGIGFYGLNKGTVYVDNLRYEKDSDVTVKIEPQRSGSILDLDEATDVLLLNGVCNTYTPTVQYNIESGNKLGFMGNCIKLQKLAVTGNECYNSTVLTNRSLSGNGIEFASDLIKQCDINGGDSISFDVINNGSISESLMVKINKEEAEYVYKQEIEIGGKTAITFTVPETVDKVENLQIVLDARNCVEETTLYIGNMNYVEK